MYGGFALLDHSLLIIIKWIECDRPGESDYWGQ